MDKLSGRLQFRRPPGLLTGGSRRCPHTVAVQRSRQEARSVGVERRRGGQGVRRGQRHRAAADAAGGDAGPEHGAAAGAVLALGADGGPWSFSHRPNLFDRRGRLMLKNLTIGELEEWAASTGERPQRAMQAWRWMYADEGGWVGRLEDTLGRQNGFSAAFCAKAAAGASLEGGLQLLETARAKDGTTKLVFAATEGEAAGGRIETVLIPVVREAGAKPRITVCVSSQVGCAMNCQFCWTGRMGLAGNLSTAQIVEQLVEARRVAAAAPDPVPITNIVFMGMGEPLANLAAVLAAADIMTHPLGLHISHNKVTVSTVGLVDQLDTFMARSSAQLALSLHATTDEVRDWIAPINRRHNLEDLRAGLLRHFALGASGGRRLLVEYVMLAGVNDGLDDATRLVAYLEGIDAKVNLIMFNPHSGTRFRASGIDQVLAFRSGLVRAGRVATIRDSRGDDEMAACGQLGNPQLGSRAAPLLEPPERFRAALCAAS